MSALGEGGGTPIVRVTPQTPEVGGGVLAPLRRCSAHASPLVCAEAVRRLPRSHEARRQTALAIDAYVWHHARRRTGTIPHRGFLQRFDPGGRWQDGSLPGPGLARAAVLYHLPWEGRRTLADRFADTPEARTLCLAERTWLDVERRARISFFRVSRIWDSGRISVRDLFGPRTDAEIALVPRAIGPVLPEWRELLFARIVTVAETCSIDFGQVRGARESQIRDHGLPVRHVRRLGRDLQRHEEFVMALFEAWELEEFPDGASANEAAPG